MDFDTWSTQLADHIIQHHNTHAAPISDTNIHPPVYGVNVWKHPHDRYPATTAWISNGTVAWGPNWEHEVPDTTPTAELAALIMGSL